MHLTSLPDTAAFWCVNFADAINSYPKANVSLSHLLRLIIGALQVCVSLLVESSA